MEYKNDCSKKIILEEQTQHKINYIKPNLTEQDSIIIDFLEDAIDFFNEVMILKEENDENNELIIQKSKILNIGLKDYFSILQKFNVKPDLLENMLYKVYNYMIHSSKINITEECFDFIIKNLNETNMINITIDTLIFAYKRNGSFEELKNFVTNNVYFLDSYSISTIFSFLIETHNESLMKDLMDNVIENYEKRKMDFSITNLFYKYIINYFSTDIVFQFRNIKFLSSKCVTIQFLRQIIDDSKFQHILSSVYLSKIKNAYKDANSIIRKIHKLNIQSYTFKNIVMTKVIDILKILSINDDESLFLLCDLYTCDLYDIFIEEKRIIDSFSKCSALNKVKLLKALFFSIKKRSNMIMTEEDNREYYEYIASFINDVIEENNQDILNIVIEILLIVPERECFREILEYNKSEFIEYSDEEFISKINILYTKYDISFSSDDD